MDLLPQVLIPLLIIGVILYLYRRRNRERARNAPLRGAIEAGVSFEIALDRVCKLGTGGFEGTRGVWIDVRGGAKQLVVGTDAFMISVPQALREFVFSGRESSISLTQMRFGPVGRDWIVIRDLADGSQVQLAVTAPVNLMAAWQALAGTGAALMLRMTPPQYPRVITPSLEHMIVKTYYRYGDKNPSRS